MTLMQNTMKQKQGIFKPPSHYMSKPKKANFFVKTLWNIDPVSSTFIFETQAVFHPAGVVTTVFVVPGKVTVKIGDGGDALLAKTT